MKKLLSMGLLLVALVVSAAQGAEMTLKLEGSTTVGPLVDAFVEVFQKSHPNVAISVTKNGSGNGATALVEKRCDIAMMSRPMKLKEFKGALEKDMMPFGHVLAMDGVCIIIHPSNPIGELTRDQVKAIYQGKVTNWNEVGGLDMPIVPISRDTESGTYDTFNSFVMKQEKIAAKVEYVNSNPQAHARVKETKGAIGYVGFGFVDRKVKGVKLDGVKPSGETIKNGSYPVSRPLYIYTDGYPELGSVSHEFCTFYLSEIGQEIIETKGFVPLTDY